MPPAPPIRLIFESDSLDRLIEDHLSEVGRGGMFIRSETPAQVGATVAFEFLLGGEPGFCGEGTVVWARAKEDSRTGSVAGMGVRFERLSPPSAQLLDRVLADKERRGDDAVPQILDDSGRPTVRVALGVVNELAAATADGGQQTKSTLRLSQEHVARLVEASRAELARHGGAVRNLSGPHVLLDLADSARPSPSPSPGPAVAQLHQAPTPPAQGLPRAEAEKADRVDVRELKTERKLRKMPVERPLRDLLLVLLSIVLLSLAAYLTFM